jgi:two-component system, LuxR family, response regulator FixJ
MSQIHVVDADVIRRNQVARSILNSTRHAEIYESISEFLSRDPDSGLVMAAEQESLSLLAAISDGSCAIPVVFYGARPDPKDVSVAVRAGALDFLTWPQPDFDLIADLERLVGEAQQRQKAFFQIQDAKRRVNTLTSREKEVLEKLARGNSNKQTAAEICISDRTVEIHRANAMRKLNAATTAEAVRLAICAGLDATLKVTW